MINYLQASVLGVLQGITELFPISSLGHSVILPRLLGWSLDQRANYFLIFLVATHLATATVLLLYYWTDWRQILLGMWQSLRDRELNVGNPAGRLGWLLVAGTVPAGILGLVFEEQLQKLFASPQITASFLALNGVLLLGAEWLRRQGQVGKIDQLSFSKAVLVGAMQALALFPGFSRTGSSMAGSLLVGLSHKDAARFSFLLATPIIGAAAVLKLPELYNPTLSWVIGPTVVGAVIAGIAAYYSVKFLSKYFETDNLVPFALYCLLAGSFTGIWFFLGH